MPENGAPNDPLSIARGGVTGRDEMSYSSSDQATATRSNHATDNGMEKIDLDNRKRGSSLIGDSNTSPTGRHGTTSSNPVRRSSISVRLSQESKPWSKNDRDDDEHSNSVELEDLSEDDSQDDEEAGLTGKDKTASKRKRRRDSALGDRIAGADTITAEEKKEADVHVLKNMIINCSLIGLWYCFSLSISLYNKWMFSPEHLNFHFPLFTTCGHMFVQFTLASLVLLFLPHLRPRHDSITNPHNDHPTDADLAAQHDTDSKKPLMSKFFYFTRIGPCGLSTGLDIGLGNMSLKYISLTFYTMCKSSSLAFVLLFAFAFRLENPSWRLVAIITTMTLGVVMMVFGEVAFSILGFTLVISAAFFSGFRWALTQILLLRNPATSNPFSSIFYLAPVMFVSLFIIAIPIEGFPALFHGLQVLVEKKGAILGPLLLVFPGIIAFLMTASEFALLQRTSVVTLSIAGIFKEVVTISAAGLVFGDALTPINISGLVVTISAIVAYNWIKIKKMREEALKKVMLGHIEREVESDGEDDQDGEEEDWNTVEGTYVTADGDIAAVPGSGQRKKRKKKKKSVSENKDGKEDGDGNEENQGLLATTQSSSSGNR